MHFLGYGLIILAVIGGYFRLPVLSVAGLAILSTFVFAYSRGKISRGELLKPNPFVDGIYLFAVQCLILFAAYLIGHFASSEAGGAFMQFVTGQRN